MTRPGAKEQVGTRSSVGRLRTGGQRGSTAGSGSEVLSGAVGESCPLGDSESERSVSESSAVGVSDVPTVSAGAVSWSVYVSVGAASDSSLSGVPESIQVSRLISDSESESESMWTVVSLTVESSTVSTGAVSLFAGKSVSARTTESKLSTAGSVPARASVSPGVSTLSTGAGVSSVSAGVSVTVVSLTVSVVSPLSTVSSPSTVSSVSTVSSPSTVSTSTTASDPPAHAAISNHPPRPAKTLGEPATFGRLPAGHPRILNTPGGGRWYHGAPCGDPHSRPLAIATTPMLNSPTAARRALEPPCRPTR